MPAGERIGLLAGWGRYPILVAEALKAKGHGVFCLGLRDHADPRLADICDDFRPIGIARVGGQIRYFRRHGVCRATMAGKLHKTVMFRRFYWLHHLPDLRCMTAFYHHFYSGKMDRADDTILGTVVETYAEDGVTLAPATDFAPELLVSPGPLTRRRVSPAQQVDIEFGWRLAKEMGRLDIGQTVAVKGRAVIAVEAVEGTDECIRRAGELCPSGNFTVVKVAKPQQDMRFDVPAIGPGTLQTLAAAGARVLAIEAGRTIVMDRDEVVRLAERHKIAIAAFHDSEMTRAAS